ncbi:MAG: GNAT family N-acetyltransferase [Candidatus Acidiferrales bacterium]
MKTSEIEVRHCHRLEEFEECVRIEQTTWGKEIVVPSPMFVVAIETGGQVLAAFDGQKIAGFTMAIAGIHGLTPFLHSHMTAVLPEYRDRGIGRALKIEQRRDALARGIRLVEWTFDPLELKNAHFNLERLGAVARRYIPNCYGITESPLHAGLPTDRLLAEWWLDSPRVETVLAGPHEDADKSTARIAIPAAIAKIKETDRARATEIQDRVRKEFELWFSRGYVATSIEISNDVCSYVLKPGSEFAGMFPE